METSPWLSSPRAEQKAPWQSLAAAPSQGSTADNANLEDAQNLVAFSAAAEAMSSHGAAPPASPSRLSVRLYEKFNAEMNRGGEGDGPAAPPPPPTGCPGMEDLNALKAALTLARHGMKPPNCNCDGPECPDYLEWLEKKIQSATGEDPGRPLQPADAARPPPLDNHHGANHKQVPGAGEGPAPLCPAEALPFSQSALSIAKEKNISLQTAIAIEALTQLSAVLPEPAPEAAPPPPPPPSPLRAIAFGSPEPPAPPSPFPAHNPNLVLSVSSAELDPSRASKPYAGHSLFQGPALPPAPSSWPQAPKAAQEGAPYCLERSNGRLEPTGLFPHTTPPKADFPEPWGEDAKLRNSLWGLSANPPPPSLVGDPMAELEQLLGSATDCIKSVFKRPEVVPGKGRGAKPKQEPLGPKGENPACRKPASSSQQLSQLLQESSFHKKTQKALQQHLHHKRSLFQDQPPPQGAPPEPLPSWWVPSPQAPLPQKPPEKPAKERKKKAPSDKSAQVKPPRKQVQIKRAKQKDSQPLFPPLKQISLEGFRSAATPERPGKETPPQPLLASTPTKPPPPPPPPAPFASSPHAEQSPLEKLLEGRSLAPGTQEPCRPRSEESRCCFPEHPACDSTSLGAPGPGFAPCSSAGACSNGHEEAFRRPGSSADHPVFTQNPIMVDDKLEELIKQFEAEFGENFSLQNSEVPGPPFLSDGPLPAQPLSPPHPLSSLSHSPEPPGGLEPPPLPPPTKDCTPPLTGVPNAGHKSLSCMLGAGQPFESPFAARSPKQIKIESSGAITVVSTTCFYSDENQNADTASLEGTPTKDQVPLTPTLSGFLESPLKYLDTPTKSLLDTPAKRAQAEFPTCDCVGEWHRFLFSFAFCKRVALTSDMKQRRRLLPGAKEDVVAP